MRSFVFLFREFLQSLKQNRFLHFTHGAQVTISLVVLGIFFVLLIGALVFWSKLGTYAEIHVFLDDALSAQHINRLEEDIQALDHVEKVVFRSKEEAAEEFVKEHDSIPLDDLVSDNPLPDSYIVGATSPKYMESIASQIEEMPGVLVVRYGKQWIEKYNKAILILSAICLVTMSLLVLFTYSSINNVIGMSIYARRAEIRIMQLVGATWWFIRWPFLFEGMFIGFMGAVTALIIIWLILAAFAQALKVSSMELAVPALGLGELHIIFGLAALLILLGLTVGFSGSLRTVNTFLAKESQVKQDAVAIQQAGL